MALVMYLKSNILITFTAHHDIYISKFSNFCMVNNHNNNDNTRIKPITLALAHARGGNERNHSDNEQQCSD